MDQRPRATVADWHLCVNRRPKDRTCQLWGVLGAGGGNRREKLWASWEHLVGAECEQAGGLNGHPLARSWRALFLVFPFAILEIDPPYPVAVYLMVSDLGGKQWGKPTSFLLCLHGLSGASGWPLGGTDFRCIGSKTFLTYTCKQLLSGHQSR